MLSFFFICTAFSTLRPCVLLSFCATTCYVSSSWTICSWVLVWSLAIFHLLQLVWVWWKLKPVFLDKSAGTKSKKAGVYLFYDNVWWGTGDFNDYKYCVRYLIWKLLQQSDILESPAIICIIKWLISDNWTKQVTISLLGGGVVLLGKSYILTLYLFLSHNLLGIAIY